MVDIFGECYLAIVRDGQASELTATLAEPQPVAEQLRQLLAGLGNQASHGDFPSALNRDFALLACLLDDADEDIFE